MSKRFMIILAIRQSVVCRKFSCALLSRNTFGFLEYQDHKRSYPGKETQALTTLTYA